MLNVARELPKAACQAFAQSEAVNWATLSEAPKPSGAVVQAARPLQVEHGYRVVFRADQAHVLERAHLPDLPHGGQIYLRQLQAVARPNRS